MSDLLFDKPVFAKANHHLVREIACVGDAIDFLEEWPEGDRDVIFDMTWKACCDAHNGFKPASAAQNAIEGFARKRGILEKPEHVLPILAGKTSNSGQISA
ncbi:MAG: DUF982 domain-containing protein [Rhizobiales bacterium]|nr:DUF982 domain-containing protein [Hyphomicrobiales bacterium]OJY05067.1 MAG: hypothetical protein BGP07_08935 [Rhizobiales bacterium 63-22]